MSLNFRCTRLISLHTCGHSTARRPVKCKHLHLAIWSVIDSAKLCLIIVQNCFGLGLFLIIHVAYHLYPSKTGFGGDVVVGGGVC